MKSNVELLHTLYENVFGIRTEHKKNWGSRFVYNIKSTFANKFGIKRRINFSCQKNEPAVSSFIKNFGPQLDAAGINFSHFSFP